MQEIQLDAGQIDRMAEKLKQSPEILAEIRRKAFEAAAGEAKKIVDRHIGGTGKVKGWQEAAVGSEGGYAKVAPQKNAWTKPTRKAGNRYAVGAVTNAIVSGHAFPGRGGRRKRERMRAYHDAGGRANAVPAKPFYNEAEAEIRQLAQHTAEQVVGQLLERLEKEI